MSATYPRWDETETRQGICGVGQRLYDLFLIAGNDGNISARISADEVLITPSGVSKGLMQPEDMITLSLKGEIIASPDKLRPSSEYRMHLTIYQHRPDVRAVVHAHPPVATGFAVAGVALDQPYLPEVVVRTGPTPLVPYAIPGGDELPESLVPYLQGHNALLMGNHGVVAYGDSLLEALFGLETVELNAKIYLTALQLGNVNFLDAAQIQALRARYLG
ncbi:MAG: class II aldolase/adducin family protein [Chloroflexi bacterium]|nr:class II aldolase/adducin family protein [Chloroflexota bacterium]